MQEELAGKTIEVGSGGGAVTIEITGDQKVRSISIDPDAVDPDDISMLEDLMVAAVNEAIGQSQGWPRRSLAL